MSTNIYVFADWDEFDEPFLVGTLCSSVIKIRSILVLITI